MLSAESKPDSRSKDRGRRHTAPLLSRLSLVRKQIIKEEAEYTLHLRKQSQQTENESITIKVWKFIGKRPLSASNVSLESDKTDFSSEDINPAESKMILRRTVTRS